MWSRVLAKTALRDAAMRSDSEAGSDVDAEMVDGDKSDGESNVKDTSTGKPGKEGGARVTGSISTNSSLAACASSPPASRRS